MDPVPVLAPVAVAAALTLFSLLTFGLAVQLFVALAGRPVRRRRGPPGFWAGAGVMATVTLVTAAAHLTQIVVWAAAFVLCGTPADPEAALYYSAQSYTAVGYGDVPVAPRWRLLGPLEAVNGLLFFGLSTAAMFAVLNHLVAARLGPGTRRARVPATEELT